VRVLICEFMDESAVDLLRAVHEVVYQPDWVDDLPRLIEAAAKADALVVRNRTPVRGALLDALVSCRVVARLGVGLDNIDVEACAVRGIQVIPATGANALSVAEYVVTTAMLLLRGAYGRSADVALGKWPRAALSQGREAAGKTLGLVGYGTIGQLTGRLAHALGMRVIAFDPLMDADHPAFAGGIALPSSFDALLSRADVISLHIPLTDSTRGLFGAQRIAAMKPDAVLINTARGGIVDELALAQALRNGHLAGAAIDVFETEPQPAAAHWQACPGLILTPHIAGVTTESNERVSSLIAERLLEALA
jgi:(S)-sulfolactate dehydrogenase